jgi:hypothetical protein
MRLLRTPGRGTVFLLAAWAAGAALLYWHVDVGPREGWQPPHGDHVCGLLPDGRTVVTVRRIRDAGNNLPDLYAGPVRLWDIDTGTLVASHFSPEQTFGLVHVDHGFDVLHIGRPAAIADQRHDLEVSLYDARSGLELTRLKESAPYQTTSWVLSPDGYTAAACGCDENGTGSVAVIDRASGRRRFLLSDCHGGICFSPDGRRFAALHGKHSPFVCDTATGREIARLSPVGIEAWSAPRQFLSDGKLLLDSTGQLWDADSGARLQQFSLNALFAPDGRAVIDAKTSPAGAWLAYYDVATATERVERRVPLTLFPATSWSGRYVSLGWANRDGSLLTVQAFSTSTALPPYLDWLRRFPPLLRMVPQATPEASVVDPANGHELMRAPIELWWLTPDRRYALSFRRSSRVFEIWDVPPRKPVRWPIGVLEVWTLAIVVSRLWLTRRARRIHPAPDTTPVAAAPRA